jgi:type IV pilus assembly protein PilM
MFKWNKPLAAIDIGSHSIKLIQLKKTGKNYHLQHFGVMPLKNESIVDGTIMDAGAVIESIRNLVQMERITTRDVVTSVSGQSVIVKKIRIQQMSEKELSESITWEAEQHIPFEISDVNLDFQIVPTQADHNDPNDNRMDVILVAARKSKMEDHIGVLNEAGLNPVIVDTDVFAIENEFEINGEPDDEVTALVDVGASAMNINVLQSGTTLFQHDIAIGGNRYNEALQNEFDMSYEEAEALKMGLGFTEERGLEQVLPMLVAVSEELCDELKRSLDFFRSTAENVAIKKIVLSGGCARMKGLEVLFSNRLRMPVEIANPFRNIHYSGKIFDPEYLQDMAPMAAVGIGLAMRRMDDR